MRFYSTLDGAVGRSHHQERILEPLQLTETEIDDLLAFLESLEGRPLPPPLLVDFLTPIVPNADFPVQIEPSSPVVLSVCLPVCLSVLSVCMVA